ncbi:SpoIIE family protein phosphatase [Geodermatophilus sp. SYSU D00815]
MASPHPRTARLRVPWRLVLLVAAGYAVGAMTSFLLFESSPTGAVLFLPAGVTLAALVLSEPGRWPWVLGTAALVEVGVDLSQGLEFPWVLGFALANTAEPLVGATLLRRFVRGLDLSRRRDLGYFLLCGGVAGPFVGGLIGSTTIHLSQGPAVLDGLLPFWTGDGLGAITAGGAVLSWHLERGRPTAPSVVHRLGLVAVTVAVTIATFWPTSAPVAYLPLPLLLWFAVRHGVPVVTEAGLALAVTANVMTVTGHGPWATFEQSPRVEAAALQLFVAVAVLTAWLLAVEIAERERARSVSRRESDARRRMEALQEVTAGLATAATTDAVAEVLVRSGTGLVADSGAVGVRTADGARLRVWTTGRPSAPVEVPLDDSSTVATAALTGAEVRSGRELAVPARAGGATVGALAFACDTDDAVEDVAAVARTLAELMAQALHRARLYESEREAAHQLQQAFLPSVPDELPGALVAGCYRPADQQHDIGGDWYDAFPLADGRIGFVVGDVVGHDLRAAAAMGRLHSALRVVAAAPHDGPAAVLEALDRASAAIPGARFATIGYGEYDPATGRLRYACAGHPPPLLVADHRAEFLPGGRSRPLAVVPEARTEAQVDVPPGAVLIWYSDGLVERRGADLDAGLARLAAVAERLDGPRPADWCGGVMRELTGGRRLHDDVVLICLRLEGVPVAAEEAAAPGEGRRP